MRNLAVFLIIVLFVGCQNPKLDKEKLIIGEWNGSLYYTETYESSEFSQLLNDTISILQDSVIHVENVIFKFDEDKFRHNLQLQDFFREYEVSWYNDFLNFHPKEMDYGLIDREDTAIMTIVISPETDIPSGYVIKLDNDSLILKLRTNTYNNGNSYTMKLKRKK